MLDRHIVGLKWAKVGISSPYLVPVYECRWVNVDGWMPLVRSKLPRIHWTSLEIYIIMIENNARVSLTCSIFEKSKPWTKQNLAQPVVNLSFRSSNSLDLNLWPLWRGGGVDILIKMYFEDFRRIFLASLSDRIKTEGAGRLKDIHMVRRTQKVHFCLLLS
jgi:hypothetical protein